MTIHLDISQTESLLILNALYRISDKDSDWNDTDKRLAKLLYNKIRNTVREQFNKRKK